MPQYPTPGEYQEALQFPAAALADPDLQEAEPDTGFLGLPQAITGAFAVVFPVHTPSGRHALKCFVTEVRDQRARYRAVSKYLGSDRAAPALPYLAPFEYQQKGIQVGGRSFPLLKMGWISGTPLDRFVAEHLGETPVLDTLAEQWAGLLADLERAGIAHGDLQHGNVLVVEEETAFHLALVDYDTMFVPSLKGRTSPEVGHRNYEHPDRSERDFGPRLDRFAGLVVYIALRALALRPELWERYDTGENILFRAADFYDPASSPLFEELGGLPSLQTLVDGLRTACLIEPQSIPTLADIRSGTRVAGRVRTAVRAARTAGSRADRYGTERRFAGRVFLPLVVIWLVLSTALLMFGTVAALAVFVGGGVALGWTAAATYRSHSVFRRRRRLRKEAAFFDAAITRLRQEVAARESEARNVRADTVRLRAQRLHEIREGMLQSQLKYHFIGELEHLPGVSHKLVTRLKLHGIRTAYHASDERVARVSEVGDTSKRRVAAWRSDLIRRHVPDLPEELSPAEERRLEHYIQQRLEALHAETARLHERIGVQEKERAEVEARRTELPNLSFGRFLKYLLRLDVLPPPRIVPPRPAATPPVRPSPQSQNDREEQPWWRQQHPA